MATDGVKIIDGDTAYDTYNEIIDLYDSGEAVESIRAKKPFPPEGYVDDFDYEVMVTAYAQAFWEIGFIGDDIIAEVKRVIEVGACVKSWTEECGAKAGKARQKELDRLWTKINSPNPKIRKRKRYRKVTEFLFEVNDVLAFQSSCKAHYAIVLADIFRYRNICDYCFFITDYKGSLPPTIEQVSKSKVLGYKPPVSGNNIADALAGMFGAENIKNLEGFADMMNNMQKNFQEKMETETASQILLKLIDISHKELKKFVDKFDVIGKLNLDKTKIQLGSSQCISDFEELVNHFDNLEQHIEESNNRQLPADLKVTEEWFDIERLLRNQR